jgi:hypothetical protein
LNWPAVVYVPTSIQALASPVRSASSE